VRADARPPALLAPAPPALVRADARPPALLALAPLALVRADVQRAAARLLMRGASRFRGVSALPPLAAAAAAVTPCCISLCLVLLSLLRVGRRHAVLNDICEKNGVFLTQFVTPPEFVPA
jgi:hypothetical protein